MANVKTNKQASCKHCRKLLYFDGKVWVDLLTGGDVCGVNGDNHSHVVGN